MSDTCTNGDYSATCVSMTELTSNHRLFGKIQELREFYVNEYGQEPQLFVRVPGRVNIIGEHVDYCGYPVLPMAIDQCILLAVGYDENSPTLQLKNIEQTKYEDYSCEVNNIQIALPKSGGPEWYKYYLCGFKGIYETLSDVSHKYYGMTIALSGNIPPSSGVSSSSALVSSSVLATAAIYKLKLDRKRLASISAVCERYIGTQGGGMDQAIAYLAKEGCAQFIEFHPELNATPLQLPTGACFVVANSLAEKNKAASSDFNERVVECRLGCRLIAFNKNFENWRQILRFVDLQESLGCSLEEMEKYAREFVNKDVYKRSELCQIFQIDDQTFQSDFLTCNTQHMQEFKLKQRTLHVIQESLRVRTFRSLCEQVFHNGVQSNGNLESHNVTIAKLSQLMSLSHESLKTLYECSHPDLDRLVKISEECGIGARLTGAGWGGCIVALCDSVESSQKYIATLKEKYFALLPPHILEQHAHNDFETVVFATFPRDGAEILSLPQN
ncbi:N-acetylgalactosamine kinase [Calliphora vicina]|uniref:N-acetylgalactosamine kinase n=1 Tax=Calliphora vicina TaxID=7373 RepID=UPI00325BB447